MRHRRLGRTEMVVTEIGLGGAWLLGRNGRLPMEEGVRTVRKALELGINYLDTAECYIGGQSEDVLGRALEGYDGEVFVATKFGHRPDNFDFSRESVLESIHESLRLLRRPYLDLFQLHTPAEPEWSAIFGDGGAVEGMREARERGLCRHLGITGNHLDFLRRCIETDVFDTVLQFLHFDLLHRDGEALFAEAKARDMGVIIASPLRMGLFGSARAEMEPRLTDDEKRKMARLDALFGHEPGGLAGGAWRFILASDAVSVALSGAGSPEEIEAVVGYAEHPLIGELADAVRGL